MKHTDFIGQIIGGCRIDTLLGKGGMGYVFLAHHLNLDIPIALKLLNLNMASSQELIQRFVLEARAAARLDSNNIVRVMQVGEEQGYHFIQMEYIEGESLAQYLKRNMPLEIPTALHFLKQIASGLNDAHVENIIHRDIKPDNVLINRKGVLKLADFGLVKTTETEKNLTATGQVLGTPYYISPEQCEGKDIDCRSDIYSLGIVMYYMLSGHLPFDGDSSLVIVVARLQNDPPPLSKYRDNIPQPVQQLVQKMMQRKPEERHQNTEQLIDEIDELITQFAAEYKYKAANLDIQVMQKSQIDNNTTNVAVQLHSSSHLLERPITSQQKTLLDTPTVENTIHTEANQVTKVLPSQELEVSMPQPSSHQTSQSLPQVPSTPPQTELDNMEKNVKNTPRRNPAFLTEIFAALLVVSAVFYGVHRQQKFVYTHIFQNKLHHPTIHGDVVKEYQDTVVAVVDDTAQVALSKTTAFLNKYSHTPHAIAIKDFKTLVQEKYNFLINLQKELKAFALYPLLSENLSVDELADLRKRQLMGFFKKQMRANRHLSNTFTFKDEAQKIIDAYIKAVDYVAREQEKSNQKAQQQLQQFQQQLTTRQQQFTKSIDEIKSKEVLTKKTKEEQEFAQKLHTNYSQQIKKLEASPSVQLQKMLDTSRDQFINAIDSIVTKHTQSFTEKPKRKQNKKKVIKKVIKNIRDRVNKPGVQRIVLKKIRKHLDDIQRNPKNQKAYRFLEFASQNLIKDPEIKKAVDQLLEVLKNQ